jgi:hypothetical protein
VKTQSLALKYRQKKLRRKAEFCKLLVMRS